MAAGHPFVITKHESRYGTVVHLSISEWLVELSAASLTNPSRSARPGAGSRSPSASPARIRSRVTRNSLNASLLARRTNPYPRPQRDAGQRMRNRVVDVLCDPQSLLGDPSTRLLLATLVQVAGPLLHSHHILVPSPGDLPQQQCCRRPAHVDQGDQPRPVTRSNRRPVTTTASDATDTKGTDRRRGREPATEYTANKGTMKTGPPG